MSETGAGRSGYYVRQLSGYRAFLPAPLPPSPALRFDDELVTLLSEADGAVGRLDVAAEFLPNPNLFLSMYLRKEAVLSSQIEGTQASMADLLEHEAQLARAGRPGDVREVWNYVQAMNLGLERLASLPLSVRLLKEIHASLLTGVRGAERGPGEFRRTQNWIGPGGCTLRDATFVPPPAHEVERCMGELERFLHDERPLPVLIKAALAHVQLETIHPFLDGNGRMGRLLITFFLCWKGVLRWPSLYLSYHFKQHREEYYSRLQAVRAEGDYEGWVRFFLRGVRAVALDGVATTRRIQQLRDEHRALVTAAVPNSPTGLVLLDYLFAAPYVNAASVAKTIGRTPPVANQLLGTFERLGLLREITGLARNRVFRYEPYLAVFGDIRP